MMEGKDYSFFSVVVVKHIWFESLYWRLVIGWNAEKSLIYQWMTWDSHLHFQYQEDQLFQGICWRIGLLKVLVYDISFHNQVLIASDDKKHHLSLQICGTHYRTNLMFHLGHHRVNQHRKHYHLVQKYHMKHIGHFELCMIYRNHELQQHFVRYKIECEEKVGILLNILEWNDFYFCEMYFYLVLKVRTLHP